jgi:uncharacterized protein (DUF169 family)
MTNQQIQGSIQSILGVKKELVGIKAWKQVPENIPGYEGKAFPGMCAQIGEVLKNGGTFHTDKENHYCTGGVAATGVVPHTSKEESINIMKMHIKMTKDHPDLDIASHYRDEMEKLIPPVEEKNAVAQVGLFKDMDAPDIVLLFCTPGTADIVNRTFSYVTGEPIQGFGGNGGCPFVIQYPFVTKKPSFTYSDISWRKFVGLNDDELTISFPYSSLLKIVESIPLVAEEYRKYGEGMMS